MTTRETAAAIDDAALAWAVRFPLDAEEARVLDAWLVGDRRRRGALTRALSAWSMLDRAQATRTMEEDVAATVDGPPPGMPAATVAPWILGRRRLIGTLGGGIAAAVAGAVLLPIFNAGSTETGLGEIRRLPLQDGSLATINTDSALEIALGKHMRKIALIRGEAWFDVAKDPARPFVVDAGDVSVRAVGTAFSVRKLDEGTAISVTEGVVAAWSGRGAFDVISLKAGEQATIGRNGLIGAVEEAPSRIQRALAWRDGEIALEGDTLADAVEEYNRYNRRKLVVDDAVLGRERLVGLFNTNDPEGFAETVSTLLNLRVRHDGSTILLQRGTQISPSS